jgi:adenine-specific DNA-methyltransferase
MSPGRDARYEGRLELTWTNKDQRLLAGEDGTYEWLPPADYRIAEVRLLDDSALVGETRPEKSKARAKDNLLIRGDALNALTSLTGLPEFSREYENQVKLAYLDPPFNTQQAFQHYDDALEHSVWLTMMRDRLVQIKKLLSPDGSVWVHCDDSEGAHMRVLMDEVFGARCFVATVVWQTRTSRENRKAIGGAHNFIHVYAPAGPEAWREVRNRLERNEDDLKDDGDPRGPWTSIPFSAQGFRKNQMYPITTPTGVVHEPPKGRCWGATEPEYQKQLEENRVHFPKDGNGRPRIKQFETEAKGLVPMSWWPADAVGDNEEAKKHILALFPKATPFDHPKPERLMQRIIDIATNPGEVVLDCFAGSGTTAAVALKMKRRWICVERMADTLETFVIPRLSKVVAGEDPGGITDREEWSGGDGFRILDVAPSMFTDDHGVVLLAEWATNGKLAEATAAQFAFDFEPDAPFTGRKGRTRLAVIDGLVSRGAVELIAGALADDERVVLCGTAIDPEAGALMRELSKGSKVRKIPASLLEEYRSARWSPAVLDGPSSSISVRT